jgi:hypothetical protein
MADLTASCDKGFELAECRKRRVVNEGFYDLTGPKVVDNSHLSCSPCLATMEIRIGGADGQDRASHNVEFADPIASIV